MNEHQIQKILTTRWLSDGVLVDGQRYFLVAWEVMAPSWRINDASSYWAEPSIDFLAAEVDGHLMAIELKTRVRGIKPAWRVLCQVTHRAMLLRDTFEPTRLDAAHRASYSGRHGRADRSEPLGVAEDHRQFFGRSEPVEFRSDDIGRLVVATEFGPSFAAVLKEFNALDEDGIERALGEAGLTNGSRSNREADRLLAAVQDHSLPVTPVRSLLLET